MRLARDVVAAAAHEKIEIRALVRLLHVLDIQSRVPAGRELQLRRAPGGDELPAPCR